MSNNATKHFIIVFDRDLGRQISFEEFASVDTATEKYRDIERANMETGEDRSYDVVLVGSDSAESVKITHASYFRAERPDASNIKRYLDEFAHLHGADAGTRRIREPRQQFIQPRLA